MESYTVRRASIADIDGLMMLFAEHAHYEQATFRTDGLAARLRDALQASPPRLHAWVAESACGLLGYASAVPEFSTWAAREYLHMDCLFVREGRRGAGVGAALLGAVVAYAQANDYCEIRWQTPAWNEDAARFYRRNGAAEIPKRRFVLNLRRPL